MIGSDLRWSWASDSVWLVGGLDYTSGWFFLELVGRDAEARVDQVFDMHADSDNDNEGHIGLEVFERYLTKLGDCDARE